MNAHRKLLILATNKLLEQKRISLEPPRTDDEAESEGGHVLDEIAGHPAAISWSNAGFDELRISVWWKYLHEAHPQASDEAFRGTKPLARETLFPKFVGTTVSGWLERKTGAHLQGHGRKGLFEVYTRRGEQSALERLPTPSPLGFAAEGKLYF